MDGFKFLLRQTCVVVIFSFAAAIVSPNSAIALTLGCSPPQAQAGACSGAQASGNGVNVWANQTMPGASGGGSVSPGTNAGSSAGSSGGYGYGDRYRIDANGDWRAFTYISSNPQAAQGYCYLLIDRESNCFQQGTPAGSPATAPVVEPAYVAPTITIADVASCAPNQPTLSTEPAGWSIVGLETNMIAGTSTHVVGGTLLGSAAEVRFTPASFEFTYGDGASRSASTAGASWSSLGLPEFSATSTSHAYGQSGTYNASVRVGFSLEYRWGSNNWIPIDSQVYGTAPVRVVLVVNAANVLVTDACHQGTPAPGC